ncbi:MAG TPA: DUF819 family protein [Spirochaetota bacterium]|nr:DUF819 family protein [Spirochaetota bacterium]HOD13592.1 DUF819 family protein [Spirochaetota bacterium]HPG51469.1 DUF819 family protein [Spirochaetota bacterium]HPN10420.1 DUF819 family protein [Spirochaetota bacterium]HQL81900.1 DUF819 family protein [Spirochaetota bacterium]
MKLVLLALFFLTCPALVIYLCNRFAVLDKLGPALLCYGIGMLVANVGVIPEGAGAVQTNMMNVSIPFALPLLLFSLDIRRWAGIAGKAFLSFGLQVAAVFIATTIAYLVLGSVVEESWKVAGMLIGVYTGGSINLNAIGLALKAKEHVLVLTNTADMLMATPYFLFMLSYGQRVIGTILPPFCMPADPASAKPGDPACEPAPADDFNDYSGLFKPAVLLPLLCAMALSCAIFGLSFLVYKAAPSDYNMALFILAVTTMGILCSFIPRVRNIKKMFQLGQYIIMIFCLVVGSLANLSLIAHAAPLILAFTGIVVYGCLAIHIILCRIFRIDTDTMIITSIAGIFSPPFVPVVAAALKNKDIIMSGIITGIIGWVIGNYLGISFGFLLKNLNF